MQVVPKEIVSENGSDINMGCASPLVDRGGVLVCNNSESYLVDGCSPTIDTSTSNWASQLVTVKKKEGIVALTFVFNTAVIPTSIEVDMFLCPEWNIGAYVIHVYANQTSSLVHNSNFIVQKRLSGSSCDSLSTVSISLEERNVENSRSWHIVMELRKYSVFTWAYVGEIRFLNIGITKTGECIQMPI